MSDIEYTTQRQYQLIPYILDKMRKTQRSGVVQLLVATVPSRLHGNREFMRQRRCSNWAGPRNDGRYCRHLGIGLTGTSGADAGIAYLDVEPIRRRLDRTEDLVRPRCALARLLQLEEQPAAAL
jgi:hypothetical protein